jgi:hypothetical protein
MRKLHPWLENWEQQYSVVGRILDFRGEFVWVCD